ncbi:MAG: TPM domain-containing protein [Chthoniobacterales bacterium]
MRFIRSFLTVAAVAVFAATAPAASTPLPAKPADYVLDEAGVFSPQRREALARALEQYERETSNQIVVAVMPRVPDDYVMEDFTQRTAEAWGAGQKDRDNGIVLFVFPESREMRIEVGYGLEGAVPDGLANIIIQDDIVPSFRAGDMAGGIERGVDALVAASKGEYTGTGRTVADEELSREATINMIIWIIFLIIVIVAISRSQSRGGHVYYPSGRRDVWFPSSGSGLGGGGFSGGFGGGFGGGGFSGGGGGFGGGGASGRW